MGKRNPINTMEKVGFIGLLLLQQAKISLGCQSLVLMKEEEKCIKDLQLLHSHKATENDTRIYCQGMWDRLNCWPPASVGETVSQPCPKHEFFNSDGKVHRNCTANGWTDLLIPHEQACSYTFNETEHFFEEHSDLYYSYVKTMYTAGYALSLVTLTVAITIFCLFRKLHCTRNNIHIQMFISFILKAIFIFIRDALLFTNEEFYHCEYYPVACKVALMFSNYSILANYSWFLAEGHFLFTLMSRSFFSLRKHLAWYIVLSWGVPLIIIVSWSCAKYFYEDEGCWVTTTHVWIMWILRVPVLLSIFMNFIFFVGILRILVGKLRTSDAQRNEFSQYKRLIKSTFFMVALFGGHYILFAFFPVEVNISVFKIKTFVELALSSTQGFVVAVLYCFMNGEVQHELRRRWRRWRLTRHLPSRRRQHLGSVSQSGPPHTQVSLLLCPPASPVTSGPPPPSLQTSD